MNTALASLAVGLLAPSQEAIWRRTAALLGLVAEVPVLTGTVRRRVTGNSRVTGTLAAQGTVLASTDLVNIALASMALASTVPAGTAPEAGTARPPRMVRRQGPAIIVRRAAAT